MNKANKNGTNLPRKEIADFCRRNHIQRLALFGSVLRGDATSESDIDFLVEFDPEHVPGLIKLAGMELELSALLGRKADMRTPQDLSRYFRQEVCDTAEVQYAKR
jgi:predicted nucleotidyltransferase